MTILEVMTSIRTRRPILVFAGLLIVTATSLTYAQQRLLTIDDIYDPGRRVNFSGNPPPEITWIDATHYARSQNGRGGVDWLKVDATTGSQTPLFDPARMEAALVKLPGVSGDEARRLSHSRSLTFNAAHTAAVLRIADDLYEYSFDDGRAVRLTNAPGAEEHVSFSPDSKSVAFVRSNNLYVSDVATGRKLR